MSKKTASKKLAAKETRAQRRARLEAREYVPLTRREERAILATEQRLERLTAKLEYD